MALPRLPSGIYFSLISQPVINEGNHTPEYPAFPVAGQPQIHATDQHNNLSLVEPSPHSPEPQIPQAELCLPLLSVSIDMRVDCNIAKTRLKQTYTNHGASSIPEAWYSFPLYDGAAVTSFRCEVGEDKVLVGKVKPKDEAKREYKRAIKKQEAAALVEEMTPEVFQTTIGNIPPTTSVIVEVTYIEELQTDLSGENIVVTIPTSVAPRYGIQPAGYRKNSAVKGTGLSVVVSITSSGSIGGIVCGSGHGVLVEYGKLDHVPNAASFEALAELQSQANPGFNPKNATARLSSKQTTMDKDFVLFIPSPDEAPMKSQALLAPSNGSEHAAMMVTVRPSELFSDLRQSMGEFDGEIIFLADRSGSMDGPKIEALKDALLVFLRSLPEKCKFNLYSFGSYVSSIWPQSRPYNDSTMQEALNHVSAFRADFGGTEVLEAMRTAVSNRLSTEVSSTQVILLTDGEIWEPGKTIEFVRKTTSEAKSNVRFFSLGIGNQVSHQLIQGIGVFGGGFGEAVPVDANGKWKEAVIRMLKGAVMPDSWSYTIEFGDGWTEKRLDLDDFLPQHSGRQTPEGPVRIDGVVNPSFLQAPRTIPLLHHFGQSSVYFLLDATRDELPDHVTITACSRYGGTKVATLKVTKVASNNSSIQHLAAKAAVRELESQELSEKPLSERVRRNAERLCQLYSIASKWTSFVAVTHLQQSADCEDVEVSLYKAPLIELDLLARPAISQPGAKPSSLTGSQLTEQSVSQSCSVMQPVPPRHSGTEATKHPSTQLDPYLRDDCFQTHKNPSNSAASSSYRPIRQPSILQDSSSSETDYKRSKFSIIGALTTVTRLMHEKRKGEKRPEESITSADEHIRGIPTASRTSGRPASEERLNGSQVGEVVQPPQNFGSNGGFGPSSPMNHGELTNNSFYEQHDVPWASFDDGSSHTTGTYGIGTMGPDKMPDATHMIHWRDVVQNQRADGFFRLDKSLAHRLDEHFCHGTREELGLWLMEHVKSSVTCDGEEGERIRLLVDTVMALAYIRSHFYSERALWDLLAQKAEGKLASWLNLGEWARSDELSAVADSALAHAHYGRSSRNSEEDSWSKQSPSGGYCGVCISQGEEGLSSAVYGDGLQKCSFSACTVSACDWDRFWAHIVEQGHIHSSCETAKTRYKEATATVAKNV